MSSFTIIIALLVLALVSLGLYLRRGRGSGGTPAALANLRDISSHGHYALFVDGTPVASEFPIGDATHRLAIFRLVPSPTEFDQGAVLVFFGPHLVGGLFRKDAAAYRAEFGDQNTMCRGTHNIDEGKHNVWLDAHIGSGVLGASSILQAPELRSIFDIPTVIPNEHLESVKGFLANNMVRIFDAKLFPHDGAVDIIIDGLVMAQLTDRHAAHYISNHGVATVGSLALIRRTVEGPTIHLLPNNKLRCLLAPDLT